ncbi:hypothetical protein KM92DES2_12128 [uncultured Desulfovibrio sp.]|uniref:Uncharacterized protein n=1 Tax=uncultured Desulfovibrio sp. TaxID=167968 RepID=A0A212K2X2_9BACT|nr:hypothetical protein KM92DES2_12128 [uncultured Desulfovibrio sp.]
MVQKTDEKIERGDSTYIALAAEHLIIIMLLPRPKQWGISQPAA